MNRKSFLLLAAIFFAGVPLLAQQPDYPRKDFKGQPAYKVVVVLDGNPQKVSTSGFITSP